MITAALDTSCGASLAIARAGRTVFQGTLPGQQREADRDLVPWIQAGLVEAQVDVATVRRWTLGVGPGSFSGIRTGIALVRGVCAVTGAACRGVPSSAALAWALAAGQASVRSIGVLHDGRCGQVVLSRYHWADGALQACGPAAVATPTDLVHAAQLCEGYVTVQGALVLPLLPEAIRRLTTVVTAVDARCLLALSGGEWPAAAAAAASLEPVYVRPPVFVAPRPPSVGEAV